VSHSMEEHPTGPRYLPSCVCEYGTVVACVYMCMVHCIMHLHNLTLSRSFGGQVLVGMHDGSVH